MYSKMERGRVADVTLLLWLYRALVGLCSFREDSLNERSKLYVRKADSAFQTRQVASTYM